MHKSAFPAGATHCWHEKAGGQGVLGSMRCALHVAGWRGRGGPRRLSAAGEQDHTLVPPLASNGASTGSPSLTPPVVVCTSALEDRAHGPTSGAHRLPFTCHGERRALGISEVHAAGVLHL